MVVSAEELAVVVVQVAAALVGLSVGTALLRGRPSTTARAFATSILGGATWSLAAAVGLFGGDAVRRVVYAAVVVPAVAVATAAFACGVYALARVDWRPGRRVLLLLAAHPATVLVLGLTDPWHHLVVRPTVVDTGYGLAFGPAFAGHTVVSYAILVGVAVLAVRGRRAAPVLRTRQLTVVILLGWLPGLGTGLQLVLAPGTLLDVGAVTFVVIGLVDAYLIFRRGALATLPVARSTVLETIRDGILVVDGAGVVADANAAAVELLAPRDAGGRARVGALVGRSAQEALGGTAGEPYERPADGAACRVALAAGTVVDVRWAPITSTLGATLGAVVVVRDVTADVEREEVLARANELLRDHLVTIERLRAEVAEQAVRDAVTGLHNRRHLDHALAERLRRATDGQPPVALAIVDADHFKAVNDRHGHSAGDRVLEALAHALTEGVAADDVLVRYGGEEFVVVMTGVDEATAVDRVQHLRALCAQARAATREGPIGVTVSAGLAFAGPGRQTPESLLDAADRALYQAKGSGRNRLCVAPAPGAPADVTLVHQRAAAS